MRPKSPRITESFVRLTLPFARLLKQMVPRPFIFLCSLAFVVYACSAADSTGLHEIKRINITPQIAASPITGSVVTSIWGVALSPDQRYLAVGVEFAKKKNGKSPLEDDKSYLLIFETDNPKLLFKKFEAPRHPAMRVYPELHWSPDGKYLSTPFFGDWEHAGIADMATGELHVIANKGCRVVGLLNGPRLVQDCGTQIRFVDTAGAILKEWTFSDVVRVLSVQSDTGQIAVYASNWRVRTDEPTTHAISILDSTDRREIRQLSPPASKGHYLGIFAMAG